MSRDHVEPVVSVTEGEPAPGGASAPRRRAGSRVWRLAGWGLVLSPLWLHLAFLPSYGRLPSDDYYGVLQRLADGERLSSDLGRWLDARINLHRVPLPAAVWAANVRLFHGSNLPTAALAIGLLVAIYALLYRQLPPAAAGAGAAPGWTAALLLSVFVFAPVHSYNVAYSFGGDHYYLADLLAVAAFVLLARRRAAGATPWGIALLGLLGGLTFSSSVAVWPVLAVGGLYLGLPWRRLVPLAAALVVDGAFYLAFQGTHMVSYRAHQAPSPAALGRYLATFLGGLWTREGDLAGWLGGAGLAVAVLLQLLIVLRLPVGFRRANAVWLMVQLYAVGNGLLAGSVRLKDGVEQAMTLRYALFPALFWLGLVVTAVAQLRECLPPERRHRVRLALATAALGGVLALSVRGGGAMRFLALRGARQPVAEVALQWAAWDEALLAETVSRNPSRVVAVRPLLIGIGHVPFDRPAPTLPRRRIPARLLSRRPHPELAGLFSEVAATHHPRIVRVRGWARCPGRPIREVVFVDRRGRQRSYVLTGLPPSGPERVAGVAADAGWEGFVKSGRAATVWRPYVRLGDDPRYYPLPQNAALVPPTAAPGAVPPDPPSATLRAPPRGGSPKDTDDVQGGL